MPSQLFTVGLFKLKMDGTRTNDQAQTYDNDNIMSFARAWTGFGNRPSRGNIENQNGDGSINNIDPMDINVDHRDVFPKNNLEDGFLGDQYPLCVDLKSYHFLRQGAKYSYLGRNPVSANLNEPGSMSKDDKVRFALNPDHSNLYASICDADAEGKCKFKSEVFLPATIDCFGDECEIEAPRVVLLTATDSTGASVPVYYEYLRPPCVELTFYENAKLVTDHRGYVSTNSYTACANPELPLASPVCMFNSATDGKAWAGFPIFFTGERIKFDDWASRCESKMCVWEDGSDPVSCGASARRFRDSSFADNYSLWNLEEDNDSDCLIQIQVNADGFVGVAHAPVNDKKYTHLKLDNQNWFKVHWENGLKPEVGDNCAAGGDACEVHVAPHGSSCLCSITVTEEAVFGVGATPSDEEMLASLFQGHDEIMGMALGENEVFTATDASGIERRLKNTRSTVNVGGSAKFRNPPSFMNSMDVTRRDAFYETEALLDHLLQHANTGPFIAHRLIQRLVSSNPSPRYVEVVAIAFKTGTYEGFGTGKVGDLAATIAAIMLDREARSEVLDGDGSHGMLREPILKVLHLMRSLDYRGDVGGNVATEEVQLNMIEDDIGMMAWHSPTVFSFYEPT